MKKKRPLRWRWIAAIAAVALLAVAAYWATTPPPQPRIVGSHVLTKTGNIKDLQDQLFADRGSLYFHEERRSGAALLQVPAAGGEVSAGPAVNGYLTDISRDGSQLLSVMVDPKRKQGDIWTQSLSAGAPRLIIEDACYAIWSADGRGIFFTRNECTELYRANADGTAVERLATVPGAIFPHLSPDGTRIRFTDGASLSFTLWEAGTDGRNLHPLLGNRRDVFGGGWSPDGKHYFFSSWDGDRWSLWAVSEEHRWWKKAESSQPYPLTFGPMSIGTPAISNDGKQLYAVGKESHGELSVYDRESGKFLPYLGGISACYVDFSRDGQWIAYVSYPEGTLWRSKIDGSDKRQLTSPPLAVVRPRWSPDGKLIAFDDLSNGDRRQMTDDSPARIYVIGADGGSPELLLAGYFGVPTWSPDGNSIAYEYRTTSATLAGSEVRILDLQDPEINHGAWIARQCGARAGPPTASTWLPLDSPRTEADALQLCQQNLGGTGFRDGFFGWPSWSRDSKFVYAQDGDSLVRVAIADHKKEQIASLQGLRRYRLLLLDRVGQLWFGLTPDGRPITTRDTGIQEIYAFDLEYK